ncbi:peptidase U32 family protein [Desulfosporosinus meridiei]|uniref:Collagenase-like protease n=1 Tax=Desulfosporosinus meridiei (strain ATCC BAA-275 / DSM 13257 / KCTC 12902 / NCIMB 13706 / S10) TaxID=768704 RepID=J7IV54_DESMD|nr:U32 family peptidase [Desulfosporosinus meridiei]AFQ42993.1 collagenase-like protease [Desulfosporosinus meridiei DSM 13257]
MKKPELLAPAGDMEKLKYALAYGADAVYMGGQAFGLRAYAGNFGWAEMEQAVSWTHGLGKKLYVTVNIFAHEPDFAELPSYLKHLEELKVDAAIVSDPGVIMMAKEVAPRLPLHLSTQANNTNSYSVRFWMNQGIERVVLARELTLQEMNDVRAKVDGGLEIFIHGAMCMSYSGRCLLSNYLTGRDANRGECTQPCRWGYALVEEKRPGIAFPIEEDERGTYVFNSHDLCLLPHLPLLKPIDIDSYKIEGRMKSVQYVASTVKVYREAIDTLWVQGEEAFREKLPQWLEEMDKVSHRDYSPGFLFGKPGASSHNLVSSHYVRDYDFVGVHLSEEKMAGQIIKTPDETISWVEQRNNFKIGEVLEVLTPQGECWSFEVKEMWDIEGVPMEVARHAQQKIRMTVPREILPYSILRRAKSEKK